MLASILRRFNNCDGLRNNKVNLFDLRDMDKFQEFKGGPTLCTHWFGLLLLEMYDGTALLSNDQVVYEGS
jgi:hypothetical protein